MRFEYADDRMPVAVIKGGITYYLTYDQIGSLRSVTDVSGNVVKRIDYDSFGNITNDTNPGFVLPFGFVGGLYDRDTGLVKFGFRDYDPNVGRWTAKDPIGFRVRSVDLYGYCLNDPVNVIDPLGLFYNQLPKLPPFTNIFPNSMFVAPTLDIISGGIEAGFAITGMTASVVGLLAGPEAWWIPVILGGGSIEAGWDAFSRINAAVERFQETQQEKVKQKTPCP